MSDDLGKMVRASDDELDIGMGHKLTPVVDASDRLVGWLHAHPDARSAIGALCQSFCAVREGIGAPVHEIVTVEPLTLHPSLECRTCGAHGCVKNGKWEPC